jgi:hypothetical protein
MLDPPELESTPVPRRAARDAKGVRMSEANPLDDERDQGQGAGSITDRAANGEDAEPDVLFPMGQFEGDGVTLGKLVKPGEAVSTTVSLSRAEVPSSGGLLNPRKSGRVLIDYVPGKVEEIPHRVDGDIDRWTFRQHLNATFATPANDEATLIRTEFASLAEVDQVSALALANELVQIAKGGAGK